jgi:acetyl/propionyl-CoA carboxylase alpha subunit
MPESISEKAISCINYLIKHKKRQINLYLNKPDENFTMIKVKINDQAHYKVTKEKDHYLIDDQETRARVKRIGKDQYLIRYGNKLFRAHVKRSGNLIRITINQRLYELKIQSENEMMLEKLGISTNSTKTVDTLKAPMPGLVIDILAKEGMHVKKGQPLLILKAMKMENIMRASHDGTVKRILVDKNQKVEKDAAMLQF